MTPYAADDFTAINIRRREIRQEEKWPDDDANTTTGDAVKEVGASMDIYRTHPGVSDDSLRQTNAAKSDVLEAIAASVDIYRRLAGESDYSLRHRVLAEQRKRMGVA